MLLELDCYGARGDYYPQLTAKRKGKPLTDMKNINNFELYFFTYKTDFIMLIYHGVREFNNEWYT